MTQNILEERVERLQEPRESEFCYEIISSRSIKSSNCKASTTWITKYNLNNEDTHEHVIKNDEKHMTPQFYTENCRQLSKAWSRRAFHSPSLGEAH